MKPSQKEFWRVANASANTIMDLQLQFDGVAQPLQIVALDGVPTGSQDGTRRGKLVTKSDILMPPAGRAEFIVSGPSVQVKHATFLTLAIDTGPGGDNDPQRPLASIHPSDDAAPALAVIRAPSGRVNPQRFEGLDDEPVTARRKLYFSELLSDPNNPAGPTNFCITSMGRSRCELWPEVGDGVMG